MLCLSNLGRIKSLSLAIEHQHATNCPQVIQFYRRTNKYWIFQKPSRDSRRRLSLLAKNMAESVIFRTDRHEHCSLQTSGLSPWVPLVEEVYRQQFNFYVTNIKMCEFFSMIKPYTNWFVSPISQYQRHKTNRCAFGIFLLGKSRSKVSHFTSENTGKI